MWPWRKKKDPDLVAIEAIKAIKSIQEEALGAVREVRSAHFETIKMVEVGMALAIKRFRRDIDAILEAHMIRSLDEDVAEFGEDVVTADFPDLDSRAVFANPYAIKDPDFSDQFDWLDDFDE